MRLGKAQFHNNTYHRYVTGVTMYMYSEQYRHMTPLQLNEQAGRLWHFLSDLYPNAKIVVRIHDSPEHPRHVLRTSVTYNAEAIGLQIVAKIRETITDFLEQDTRDFETTSAVNEVERILGYR